MFSLLRQLVMLVVQLKWNETLLLHSTLAFCASVEWEALGEDCPHRRMGHFAHIAPSGLDENRGKMQGTLQERFLASLWCLNFEREAW